MYDPTQPEWRHDFDEGELVNCMHFFEEKKFSPGIVVKQTGSYGSGFMYDVLTKTGIQNMEDYLIEEIENETNSGG